MNGKKVLPETLLGALLCVPLEEGTNRVEIRYIPRGIEAGIVLTAIGVTAFAVTAFGIQKRKRKGRA